MNMSNPVKMSVTVPDNIGSADIRMAAAIHNLLTHWSVFPHTEVTKEEKVRAIKMVLMSYEGLTEEES